MSLFLGAGCMCPSFWKQDVRVPLSERRTSERRLRRPSAAFGFGRAYVPLSEGGRYVSLFLEEEGVMSLFLKEEGIMSLFLKKVAAYLGVKGQAAFGRLTLSILR